MAITCYEHLIYCDDGMDSMGYVRYIPYLLRLQLRQRLSSLPPPGQFPLYCPPMYSAKNRRRNTATQSPSPAGRPVLV